MLQMILVSGVHGPSGSVQVCVWERHPAHAALPDGELYIVSGQTVAVAMTPGVSEAIHQGKLRVVEMETDTTLDNQAAELVEAVEPEIAQAEPTAKPVRGKKWAS